MAEWTSVASILTIIFASLSCPLLQPPTSGPFTSSFGGAGFSDDPFKSKQDTPALPPKKPAPPRPKPPSGQYAFFSRSRPPTVRGRRGEGDQGLLCSPAKWSRCRGPALEARGSPYCLVTWVLTGCVPGARLPSHPPSPHPWGPLAWAQCGPPGWSPESPRLSPCGGESCRIAPGSVCSQDPMALLASP